MSAPLLYHLVHDCTSRHRDNAPAQRVWAVFSNARHWPAWTPWVTSVVPLDGPTIEVGHRFRIKQPWLPALVWRVTEVDAPHSWTWEVRSVGATTSPTHV